MTLSLCKQCGSSTTRRFLNTDCSCFAVWEIAVHNEDNMIENLRNACSHQESRRISAIAKVLVVTYLQLSSLCNHNIGEIFIVNNSRFRQCLFSVAHSIFRHNAEIKPAQRLQSIFSQCSCDQVVVVHVSNVGVPYRLTFLMTRRTVVYRHVSG